MNNRAYLEKVARELLLLLSVLHVRVRYMYDNTVCREEMANKREGTQNSDEAVRADTYWLPSIVKSFPTGHHLPSPSSAIYHVVQLFLPPR
jgi:hypothetical protein